MEELGATITEYGDPRTELLGNIDAPPGKLWYSNGCHSIALGFKTNRPAGWLAAIQDMEGGLVDCDEPECEVCAEEGRLRPMDPSNGPGWRFDIGGFNEYNIGERTYQLWAPREDRPQWAANWQRDEGYAGGHRRADSLDEALTVFPDDEEGRKAAQILRKSADEENQ